MRRVALLAVVSALVVAACDSTNSASLGDSLLTRSADGRDDEMTAIVGGLLELDAEKGCITLSGRPVVWPAATTVSTEPPELLLPDGSRARDGHTIKGGGGEVPAAALDDTTMEIEGDLDAALACAGSGAEAVVFHRDGHLAVGRASALIASPATYPACGTYWNRNTPATAVERHVNRCIVRAFEDNRQARAVAALTTIEGDPIVNYIFVRGARNVLVISDATRDRFGTRTWSRSRCVRLVETGGRLGWTRCRTTGAGRPSWLTPIRLPR